MQAARSKIHLWSDAWTSGNHHGILATGGTYWSSDNKLTTILMDMKELHGAHTGLNIGRNWLRIVEEWSIQENLGWFTTDNAYSNDAGCRALSTGLFLLFIQICTNICVGLFETFGVDWDPIQHRIRCSGHILNLTSNAFMMSYDEDTVDEDNNEPARERGVVIPTVEQMKVWRRKGARGKCRNFAFRVISSPQTVQKWLKCARRLVPRPNSTRWSSENFMIEVMLELRQAYETFW